MLMLHIERRNRLYRTAGPYRFQLQSITSGLGAFSYPYLLGQGMLSSKLSHRNPLDEHTTAWYINIVNCKEN